MKKYVLIYICLFLTGILNLYGQSSEEEISGHSQILHFRFDRAMVDSGYASNRKMLTVLSSLFSDSAFISRIDSIQVYAFASPDGKRTYNDALTYRRAIAVKNYLIYKYPLLDQSRIFLFPQGENRQGFRKLVEQDGNIPDKEEVLILLEKNVNNHKTKSLLKKLNDGNAYRYIQKNILPQLRSAAICTVWFKQADKKILITRETAPISISSVLVNTSLAASRLSLSNLPATTPNPFSVMKEKKRVPFLALKTNMLFDILLMPNVEVELPIRKHWSLNGELMFPWWLFDNNKYCLQILSGGLEGRYWLGNRKKHEVLIGHFAGLYAGGGKYDLQWKENGYQGEFFIAAGISYGYAKRIAKNLHLEFNVGIGLLRTTYKHYHTRDNYQTLLWQNNGRYTWVGATKAKISLVWMLNRKVKGGVR